MLRLRATCLYPVSTPSGGIYSPASVPMRHECSEHDLKGNSHQISLSEMSLPGVEVVIEKLITKILGRLGKDNPSKRRSKDVFVERKCAMTSSVSAVRYIELVK